MQVPDVPESRATVWSLISIMKLFKRIDFREGMTGDDSPDLHINLPRRSRRRHYW